ncbi:MAG: type II secretion system major pseudopilin GspG [Oligosphaeraceae bacterium]|nr:type II secretion system major pseudopilin GspG [Oligosphaeraceae bacterium]
MKMRKALSRQAVRRPFTLIEIMIVVVIIGMLAALVGPNLTRRLDKAKVNTTKAQLVNLKNAVLDFRMDVSEYPSKLEDLLVNPGQDKWDGPYLDAKTIPKDSWDQEFQYRYPGDDQDFDIISLGSDKASGGDGDASDLSCWN